ncbi:hypothetical protein LO763_24475 [Glycomyces sp. A-F 0318]|uniref:hypothetical protein n=1 Tax=Glycomyces amatae TaxID=2881355 RepID=UPI001E2EE50F|nr:hypothetical protein [Glycomyces amatae]MCD0446779.1 hypothetical protein [Glycomyces amatae]
MWTTLLATLLGAVIATGATILVERRRERRAAEAEWRQVRRELYGSFLATLSQARHELRVLLLETRMPAEERIARANEAWGRCYVPGHQMEVLAAPDVARPAVAYFHAVRDLREAIVSGEPLSEAAHDDLLKAVFATFKEVKQAMRADLSSNIATL